MKVSVVSWSVVRRDAEPGLFCALSETLMPASCSFRAQVCQAHGRPGPWTRVCLAGASVQGQNQDAVKAWGSSYTTATHKMLQSHWTTESHTNPSLQKGKKRFCWQTLPQYLGDAKLASLEESPEITWNSLLWPCRTLILRLEKHVERGKAQSAVTWVFQIIWGRYLRGNLLINQTQAFDQMQPDSYLQNQAA